jgi:hypothetical protein
MNCGQTIFIQDGTIKHENTIADAIMEGLAGNNFSCLLIMFFFGDRLPK